MVILCGLIKYPYPPQGWAMEIQRGRGLSLEIKPKFVRKSNWSKTGNSRGWEGLTKNPSLGDRYRAKKLFLPRCYNMLS